MEQYRVKLKRRLAVSAFYNAAVLALVFGIHFVGRRSNASDIAMGFSSGVLIGLQAVMLFFIGKYWAALRDERKLRALYIAEQDERTRFIEAQIGGIGINVIIGGLTLGVAVAVYFNPYVFFALLAALMFSLLVKGSLKLYYRKKV